MQNWKTRITKLSFLIGIVGTIMLFVSACSNNKQSSTNDGKISIVTVYADIAKNIVGKYGSAKAIIKNSATDPHDYSRR